MNARGLTPAPRLVREAPMPRSVAPTQIIPRAVRHPLRAAVLRIAAGEVGIKEQGGNNEGERIREYQKATWLAPGPWPWCAAFVCWVVRQALAEPGVLASIGQTEPEPWRPLTAGAFDFERWARNRGLNVKPEMHQARAGDLVIFDFSHIGIVEHDQAGREIFTIEGNTNNRGTRDSASGDGVWRKSRDYRLTKCYIELAP